MKCYTLGHSNLAISELLRQLARVDCQFLVDIRFQPYSARHPQFSKDALRKALAEAKIQYHWAGRALGGMRQGLPNSLHTALANESLRAYADHTGSDSFIMGVVQLHNLMNQGTMVLMCAEADPLQCHRSILSDFLLLQGVEVVHLRGNEALIHILHPCARRESAQLIYDRFQSMDLFAESTD